MLLTIWNENENLVGKNKWVLNGQFLRGPMAKHCKKSMRSLARPKRNKSTAIAKCQQRLNCNWPKTNATIVTQNLASRSSRASNQPHKVKQITWRIYRNEISLANWRFEHFHLSRKNSHLNPRQTLFLPGTIINIANRSNFQFWQANWWFLPWARTYCGQVH